MPKITLLEDGKILWEKTYVVDPGPVDPVPGPVPTPTPGPTPAGAILLAWGMNPLNSGARISFQPGQTQTWIARVPQQVRGWELIYTVQSDFRVDCKFQMPLKPDGTPYRTSISTNLWASYDGAIHIRFWSKALWGQVDEPCIYPGDFILTCTADMTETPGGKYGSLTTSLTP